MRQPAERQVPTQDCGWLERHPAAVLTGAALFLCTLISPLWYATPDAAAYLSIARRLAQDAAPHAFGQAQPSFPLGYPLLISPAFHIAPHPFLLLSGMNWLLAIAFMLGTYQWMRRVVPDAAVLLTLLVMAHINVWNLYRRTLSEVVFLPLLMWIVVLANGAFGEHNSMRRGARVAAITIMLVWLTATREIGLLAALAVIALAAFGSECSGGPCGPRRRPATPGRGSRGARAQGPQLHSGRPVRVAGWKRGLPLAILTAAAAGSFLALRPERRVAAINAMLAAFGGGSDANGNAVAMVLLGLRSRIVEVAQLTVPGMFKGYSDPSAWWDVNLAVGIAVVAVIAAGWYRLVQRRADALLIMGPLYFVALILWPYESAARYLLPLLPLFVACGWEAWGPLGSLRRPLMALTVVAHFGVAIGYWWLIDLPRARACSAAWPEVDRLAANLTSHAESVAALAIPSCVHLALQRALDRPVLLPEQSDVTGAVWIVTPAEYTAVSGFSAAEGAGPFRLWRRVPPQ